MLFLREFRVSSGVSARAGARAAVHLLVVGFFRYGSSSVRAPLFCFSNTLTSSESLGPELETLHASIAWSRDPTARPDAVGRKNEPCLHGESPLGGPGDTGSGPPGQAERKT